VEKQLPKFIKVGEIRTSGRATFDAVVKVVKVTPEATRTEKRSKGREISTKVTEALVGDETGAITLSTRLPEKATELKEGATLVLLNVGLRRSGDLSWIEVDTWAGVKNIDACKDLLPADFKTDFTVDTEKDRSRRIPPKPAFTVIKDLMPEQRGLHLLVKVVDVTIEERKRADGSVSKIADAVIGDKSGRVTLLARGGHGDALKKDEILSLFNARVEMNKGHMRLVVDRWSDVKSLADVDKALLPEDHLTAESTIGDLDKSAQEWMLQEEAA